MGERRRIGRRNEGDAHNLTTQIPIHILFLPIYPPIYILLYLYITYIYPHTLLYTYLYIPLYLYLYLYTPLCFRPSEASVSTLGSRSVGQGVGGMGTGMGGMGMGQGLSAHAHAHAHTHNANKKHSPHTPTHTPAHTPHPSVPHQHPRPSSQPYDDHKRFLDRAMGAKLREQRIGE